MSSQEALYEEQDDRPESERELDAYRESVRGLTAEDILFTAISALPYEPALLALADEQLDDPYGDRPVIHPDVAQAVTRAVLRAIRASIGDRAGGRMLVGGSSTSITPGLKSGA